MNFFIVFQNQNYDAESKNGYLCAAQKDKGGKPNYFWTNVKEISKGDIIFSIVNQKLKAFSEATKDGIAYNDKSQFDIDTIEPEEGFLARAKYHQLSQGIPYEEFVDEIMDMVPREGAPFDKNHQGKRGYLFELKNKKAGRYLIDLLSNRESDEEIKELLKGI